MPDSLIERTPLQGAWAEIIAVIPATWNVGEPSWHVERSEWHMHAWDTAERVSVGKRSREWTAVGATEVAVIREMARCLRESRDGRVPK